jgi:AbrB family transcriptional regulator (stage V sporulation protein T)
MKATGIVRRIDDLGRVVIPKEIRRTMRIREGDPLEIYTDRDGEVIFKKYSPIGELGSFASQYAETLHKSCDLSIVICDRDAVIACAGVPRKDFMEKRLSADLESVIESRNLYTMKPGERRIYITEDNGTGYFASCIMPIITEGDITGCVAAVIPDTADAKTTVSDTEQKLIQTAALFLGKQLEQ